MLQFINLYIYIYSLSFCIVTIHLHYYTVIIIQQYKYHRTLIQTAQSIDPTYCDVHQQFAHVYFQQSQYLLFEKESVKALLCPFSMGQAMHNWNQYWKVVLSNDPGGKAKERYDDYMKEIQVAVKKAERDEEERERRRELGLEVERGEAMDGGEL